MEQPSGPTEAVLGKRKSGHSDEGNNSAQWDSTSSSFSAFHNATQGYGSPTVDNFKRSKQQGAFGNEGQNVQQHFWVWDHCMQQQASPGTQLQPADSSTAQTFAAATTSIQPADNMNCNMADSRPGLQLVRTSSAPELLKLAQADSAAWHAQHQSQQQAAYLSHRDYWLT